MNLLQPFSLYSRLMLVGISMLTIIVAVEVLVLGSGAQYGPLESESTTVAPADIVNVDTVTFPSLPTFRELLTRPLFTDTRRPAPRPAAQAAQGVDLGKKWKLTGIIVAGDDSHVYLHGVRDKTVQRLDAGAVLDGWELVEIAPGYATFRSAGREATLELRKDADKP
jgi:hypothetical protein